MGLNSDKTSKVFLY